MRTHPHLSQPTDAQLIELTAARPDSIVEVYLGLHKIVREAAPDARWQVDQVDHVIGYGARQFGYDGWGMAAVSPHSKWASLTLLRGADLPDPMGLLWGTGAAMRLVKVPTPERLAELSSPLSALVRAARESG